MKRQSVIARILEGGWGGASFLFLLVLVVLFHGVFWPGYTLFANDGPLGELMSQCHRFPDRFTGCWQDLGSVGFSGGVTPLNISSMMQWLLGPIWFSRIHALFSLFLLGSAAWFFFRQSRLS